MQQVVLVVERDAIAKRQLQHSLSNAGFAVKVFSTRSALQESRGSSHAILVGSSFARNNRTFLERVRCESLPNAPVLLILHAGPEDVEDLRSLCDGFLHEPIDPKDVIASLRSLQEASTGISEVSGTASVDFVIDRAGMKVEVQGNEINTTALEFRLVDYLARHRGHVFTRDVLLDAVWGEMHFVTPRSVDACIRRLRRKIEPDCTNPTYLRTVRGIGYRFDALASWAEQ